MKKLFSLALLFTVLAVAAFGITVSAADSTEAVFSGKGTIDEPYQIFTETEFINFGVGNMPEGGISAYWSLEADIELTADTWAPIGAYTPFSGVFDGKGHTISSTKLFQSTAMSGIFGQNAGTIKNLNVDVDIKDVATNTGTLCATNTGRIENCFATGSITTNENKNIGGLVGYNNGGTIYNSGANVIITAPNSTVGGVVGNSTNGKILYCYNSNDDDESVIEGNTVGGLVGYVYNNNSNITSVVSNCYSLSKIAGGSNTGGLIGYCCAYSAYDSVNIEYCYAKGVITKGSGTGGLIGNLNTTDRITVRYCYYNTINSGNKYGFGMSLLSFTKKDSFYDWNFDTVWAMDSAVNNGYPYLNLTAEEEVVIDGEGTKESPYIVTTEKHLCYIASEKLPLSAHYRQEADITITANFWTPIGGDGPRSFSGVFDGNGYEIKGAHLENSYHKYMGLFGRNGTNGTLKNITAEGWYTGNAYAGGLVGYNWGTIDNCNSYIEDDEYIITGIKDVGGLVGHNDGGKILNSYSSSNVKCTDNNAGGLVGFSGNSYIEYCYATGDVTGKNAGGLIGYLNNDVDGYTTTLKNSYATGRIAGTSYAGGLIGYCKIYGNSYGYIYVAYCYSRGRLETTGTTGGLIGNINTRDRVEVRYCYYNSANTGNKIGFGVPVADLKKEATFYNWDFENIWKIDKTVNTNLPYLDVTGETEKTVLQGNGEEDRPYLIYTEKDLVALVDDIHGNYDLSVKHFYKLMNDIEVTANFWTPIGANAANIFRGIFDGNGYTISGINLTNTNYRYVGLFGYSTGTIKNLTVEATLDGRENVGIIASKVEGGIIDNCHVSGTVSSSVNDAFVGGITGHGCGSSVISNCTSSANVNSVNGRVGGISGLLQCSTIQYCSATGEISGKYAGGLVGHLYNDDGTVTTVFNSYARNKVSGSASAGGIAGYTETFYGDRGYTHIEFSYSTGKVTGGTVGGLVGAHNNVSRNQVRYSYYNGENTGNLVGFRASLGQMKEQDFYYMWNFKNIWAIDESINDGFPYLNVNGKIKKHTLEGYGDEDDPYMIYTEEDLWTLVDGTFDLNLESCYQLQNDIELTAEFWTPIGGNGRTVFNGIFDGNGYTISGLKLYNSELPNQGLFGRSSGIIKNVKVIGNIDGNSRAGLICGYNQGTIENCHACGKVIAVNNAGGITGYNANATVTGCSSSANVSSIIGDGYAGGIAGYSLNAKVKLCSSSGDVNGKYAGGIVGYLYNDNDNTVSSIYNSYSRSSVSGSTYAGGLVGYTKVYGNSYGYTHIEFSYSTGKVSGGTKGGLVGASSNAQRNEILSSYYNTTTTGLTDIDRGTPLEDSAMKLQASYVGYDFDNVWAIDEGVNNGYPTLQGIEPVEFPVAVSGVALNTSEMNIGIGGVVYLIATVSPDNASNSELIWSSSNDGVATVYDGKVVGMTAGTATITVTTCDGRFSASCAVKVTSAPTVAVDGVSLDKTAVTVKVGETLTLVATVSPDNATNTALTWSSSKGSVAVVNNGVVTAKTAGTATITVTTVDGGKTATCVVTVVDESTPDVIVGDVNGDCKINTADLVLMAQYIADWGVTVSSEAADVNVDGKINTADLVLMAQYVAGWGVTLG